MITMYPPWGKMWLLHKRPQFWIKLIRVDMYQRTSLQYHNHRNELHIRLDKWWRFEWNVVPKHHYHRMGPGLYLEIAWGNKVDEADIVRKDDDYDRA